MNAPEPRALQTAHSALATSAPPIYDLSPRNFDEAWRLAEILADSDLVPKDFRNKPGNCLVGMQWGHELGLKALQSLQGIAVINGRPSVWGDTMLAIVRASPLCEYVVEGWDADGTAWCKVKRRGEPEQVRTFSDADAKTAELLGKAGPWKTAPKRMKQMRARAFALRDVFTDILRGMHMAEESADIPPPAERHMGAVDEVQPATPATPALLSYTEAEFEAKLPGWSKVVAEGRKTASDMLAFLGTRATFTEPQKARILSLKKATPAAAAPEDHDSTPQTYAQLADAINACTERKAAELILDAGEHLPDDQRADLAAMVDRKFPNA